MRNLLFGSIFSLFLIGTSDGDPASADNETGLSLAKPLPDRNAWANAYVHGDDAFTQQHIASQIRMLAVRLSLTSAQTAEVRFELEAVAHGAATRSVWETLHEVCTPRQFAVWESENELATQAAAADFARSTTSGIDRIVSLTDIENQKLYRAFYQLGLQDHMKLLNIVSNGQLDAHQAHVEQVTNEIADAILSPAQRSTYDAAIEERRVARGAELGAPLAAPYNFSLYSSSGH